MKNILPASGATDVPVDAFVLVEFSGDLDAGNLGDPVLLEAGGVSVEGTYAYDAEYKTLTFTPSAELAFGTTYSVTVSDGLRSQSGGTLNRAMEWAFTTALKPASDGNDGDEGEDGDEGGTGDETETPGERVPEKELPKPEPGMPSPDDTEIVLPGVASVSPMPWTRASRTTTVDVVFTKEFDPGVLEGGVKIKTYNLFWGALRAWFGLDVGGETGRLAGDGDTATYTFSKRLSAQRWYWVFLEIDLEDDVGNPLKGKANWLFKTISN